MGIRGELYSTKVILENRTYFFNVKENRLGDPYLNIVESKNKDAGGFDRQSIVLFADDPQDFLKGFDESLRVMEKSVKEKKREVRNERAEREDRPAPKRFEKHSDREGGFKPRGDRPFDREGGFKPRGDRGFDREGGFKPRGDRGFDREGGFKPHGDRGFDREGGFKPRGDRGFDREGGFKPRGDRGFDREGGFKPHGDRGGNFGREGSFDGPGRKKFVKAAKHTAGSHGIKGPLHKNRIVKAVRKRDLPED